VLAVACPDDCDPLSRPGEDRGVGDRDEPEVALCEPLPEEANGIVAVGGLGQRTAEDLAEAGAELVCEGGHTAILERRRLVLGAAGGQERAPPARSAAGHAIDSSTSHLGFRRSLGNP
jgi:hypothetical protein